MNFKKLTEGDFKYLKELTLENYGIVQHTIAGVHDLKFGFATDDNARALLAAYFLEKDFPNLAEFKEIYLKNVLLAQNGDGSYYCYLSDSGEGRKLGFGDWSGRATEALAIILNSLNKDKREIISKKILQSFNLALNSDLEIRTISFFIISAFYLFKNKNLDDFSKNLILKCLKKWEKQLLEIFKKNSSDVWLWPENTITYDNGKLIESYLLLGKILKSKELLKIGRLMLDFYLCETFKNGYFQAPGNKGWWSRESKVLFDEQALEAFSLISALTTSEIVFKDKNSEKKAKEIYKWYFGKNRLKASMVDEKNGGVYDGLKEFDINKNKGAESYLAMILANICIEKKVII